MEEVLNGYVTNPNPTPTLTSNPNRNPNSNPNPNQINKKIQKETNHFKDSLDPLSFLNSSEFVDLHRTVPRYRWTAGHFRILIF